MESEITIRAYGVVKGMLPYFWRRYPMYNQGDLEHELVNEALKESMKYESVEDWDTFERMFGYFLKKYGVFKAMRTLRKGDGSRADLSGAEVIEALMDSNSAEDEAIRQIVLDDLLQSLKGKDVDVATMLIEGHGTTHIRNTLGMDNNRLKNAKKRIAEHYSKGDAYVR